MPGPFNVLTFSLLNYGRRALRSSGVTPWVPSSPAPVAVSYLSAAAEAATAPPASQGSQVPLPPATAPGPAGSRRAWPAPLTSRACSLSLSSSLDFYFRDVCPQHRTVNAGEAASSLPAVPHSEPRRRHCRHPAGGDGDSAWDTVSEQLRSVTPPLSARWALAVTAAETGGRTRLWLSPGRVPPRTLVASAPPREAAQHWVGSLPLREPGSLGPSSSPCRPSPVQGSAGLHAPSAVLSPGSPTGWKGPRGPR